MKLKKYVMLNFYLKITFIKVVPKNANLTLFHY